jgi:hypothetical protein
MVVFIYFFSKFRGERFSILAISLEEGSTTLHLNMLAYAMMFSLYLNLLAFFYVNKSIKKILCLIFSSIYLLIIIMTLSRNTLASLLLGLCSLYFFNKKICLVILCGFCIGFLYHHAIDEKFFSSLLIHERFSIQRMINDKASGRTYLWEDYLKFANLRDFLTGRGYGGSTEEILYQKPLSYWDGPYAVPERLSIYKPHNIYVYVRYRWTLCLYLFTIFLWQKNYEKSNSRLLLS